MVAAEAGHDQVVEYLLNAGADPCVGGVLNVTALHLAAQAGHLQCLRFLILAGTLAV